MAKDYATIECDALGELLDELYELRRDYDLTQPAFDELNRQLLVAKSHARAFRGGSILFAISSAVLTFAHILRSVL